MSSALISNFDFDMPLFEDGETFYYPIKTRFFKPSFPSKVESILKIECNNFLGITSPTFKISKCMEQKERIYLFYYDDIWEEEKLWTNEYVARFIEACYYNHYFRLESQKKSCHGYSVNLFLKII